MKISSLSVGVDIEDINRFNKLSRKKDEIFLNRVFSEKELEYCFSQKKYAQHLAVRYCAKEAIIKALHNISDVNIEYKDIEIRKNNKGTPYAVVGHKDFRKVDISISLSHCENKAIAFTVIH